MARDAKHPGPKCARIREIADAAIHGQPDLLLYVIRVVAKQTGQIATTSRTEHGHQLGKRPLVAGLTADDDQVQRQPVRIGWGPLRQFTAGLLSKDAPAAGKVQSDR